jgi:ATP-dependent DNA helicase RecQ
MDSAGFLQRYWGYTEFLSLQKESIASILARKDSLTVLPTGGGKSLCFQLPAMILPGTAVIISPLIALMKDQVDSLTAMGIAAASLNSSQTPSDRREVLTQLQAGTLKLLYMAPEAFASPRTLDLLRDTHVSFFAIDEAHCISEWGHEYRPDYRNLGLLKNIWPEHGIHAFTATATIKVRQDICGSLSMVEPEVFVGSFDRPNLVFRAVPKQGSKLSTIKTQLSDVIARHPNEAGIVYCISRAETEELAKMLVEDGIRAVAYHAGLSTEERTQNQEAFAKEEVDIVVATIAFGMGINRTNVRFVVHTGLPRSLESWQQEAGRAGRDGLPAECVILYSYSDVMAWKSIQKEAPWDRLERLNAMYRFCRAHLCRHRLVVEHFGERFSKSRCGACDVCLGELALLPESTLVARKVLSGVARSKERYGAHYVADMLVGKEDARVKSNGHDLLSTFGILKDLKQRDVVDLIDQLQAHAFLSRDEEIGSIKLTKSGWELMRGEGSVELTVPVVRKSRRVRRSDTRTDTSADTTDTRTDTFDTADTCIDTCIDTSMLERLKVWRRQVAERAAVAPYVVFSDATLMELVRCRPVRREELLKIKGIGNQKAERYGGELMAFFAGDCEEGMPALPVEQERPLEERAERPQTERSGPKAEISSTRDLAFTAFEKGSSLEEVIAATGRVRTTVEGYLVDWLVLRQQGLLGWVALEVEVSVLAAVAKVGKERLKPIFETLGGAVPYWQIRAVLAVSRKDAEAQSG